MFQVFRRNQRKWMVSITILAIGGFAFGTTVMSNFGGRGDRSGRQKANDVVATIYNRPVKHEDLGRLGNERQLAHDFIVAVIAELEPGRERNFPDYAPFGSPRDEEDLTDALRLEHKADEYGINVSDEMVSDWIKAVTAGRLSTDQFNMALSRVGRGREHGSLSSVTLYSVLRRQLRIRMARNLVFGGSSELTPYETWQFFRRMNDKFSLAVIPVEVANFIKADSDPGNAKLEELFERHKHDLPDTTSPTPGFKEPRRIKLQYAHASVNGFALDYKPEISDDEIQKYYDQNKQWQFRVRTKPSEKAEPKMDEDGESKSETTKSDDPDKDKPAPSTDNPPEKSDNAETKEADKKAPAPADGKDAPKPDGKNDEDGKSKEPCNESSGRTNQDDAKPDDQPKDKPQGDAPADAKQDAKPKESDDAAKSESQDATKPDSDSKAPDDAPAKKPDEPKYQTLEEVREKIHDELSKQRARAEIISRLGQVGEVVYVFGSKFVDAKAKFEEAKANSNSKQNDLEFTPPDATEFNQRVQARIKELALEYTETDLLDSMQMLKLEGLGDASEGFDLFSSFGRRRSVLASVASAELYEPRDFSSLTGENGEKEEYFFVWKVADQPERVPSFSEARGRVLTDYRAREARGPARKHAEERAVALKAAIADIDKFKEAHPDLKVLSIANVPMWSLPSFNPMSGSGAVVPTPMPDLRLPTEEMRTQIFGMKVGETCIAVNQPEDFYFVVLVTEREPATYESFARSRSFIEMQLQSINRGNAVRQSRDDLRQDSERRGRRALAGN